MESSKDTGPKAKPQRLGTLRRGIRRFQKRTLVAWVRFARRHRDSPFLPIGLFCVLFFDGFLVVMPSMIITAAAVTITPRRWWLFAVIFIAAMTLNNYVIYWVGRLLSPTYIFAFIEYWNLQAVYDSAERAVERHGALAALIGAAVSLPTQMITLMIGMADSQQLLLGREPTGTILRTLGMASLGHALKMFIFCGIIRYGWVKIEQRVLQELEDFASRFR